MCSITILLVEDNEGDIQTFKDTVKRYQAQKNVELNYNTAPDIENAKLMLNSSYDGAIVDLRMQNTPDEGNKIIEEIHKKYRIPVVIYTGTPISARDDSDYVKVFIKGDEEAKLDIIFDYFFDLYKTGITKIMGGRGLIEDTLNNIFWKAIVPNTSLWLKYATEGKQTETALLRVIINHFQELLHEGIGEHLPIEMYIHCDPESIKTGCIVQNKGSQEFHVVLSPACDLTVRAGCIKTDRILVCQIENHTNSFLQGQAKRLASEDPTKKEKAEKVFSQLPRNTFTPYFHFLPKTTAFTGGILNFRKISTFKPSDFDSTFKKPTIQIAAPFVKDIVSRYSSYYARQGQPDFNFAELTQALIASART